ncbi:DUF4476 domain-containing protein [Flavobacterium caeni]|uniref:DUF4476 domain-containing protein n=1 Tax=Flavobacterium caeni TaxID=490189 RepID=A0A1G5HRH3_9FLAO|nr:DUF4476 domain-containing protein [Flavobacterium caeni]SCY65890.1 protein of unknown function [Flavobacterium caeni]
MKKTTLSVLMFFVGLCAIAQTSSVGHLTIFSESGDKFFLILNGEKMNDVAQTNLRIEDLPQPYYNARIIFENKKLQDITKNYLALQDADAHFVDVTYKIKNDKKDASKRKLGFFSQTEILPTYVAPANVFVVHYGQPRTVQTTTTTTTTSGGGAQVGMNVGGVNMNVQVNDGMMGTTQTTTTTTTIHDGHDHHGHNHDDGHGHGRDRGCSKRYAMSPGDFNAALSTIKKQSFDDSKLKTAKQVVSSNCLNTNQIMQIAQLFSFEDNTLEFAKFAYDYCIEPRSYFKLNGIFKFSSNADELSDYVQSRQ